MADLNKIYTKTLYSKRELHQNLSGGQLSAIYDTNWSTLQNNVIFLQNKSSSITASNFKILFNDTANSGRLYNQGVWVKPVIGNNDDFWTYDEIYIEDEPFPDKSLPNKADSWKLKLNWKELQNYALYGSISQLVKSSIEDIIDKFPASLWMRPKNSVTNLNNELSNPFNIDIFTDKDEIIEDDKDNIKIFSKHFDKYESVETHFETNEFLSGCENTSLYSLNVLTSCVSNITGITQKYRYVYIKKDGFKGFVGTITDPNPSYGGTFTGTKVISSILIIDSGEGYSSSPTITVEDKTGSGATFNTVVSDGKIISISVVNPGSNYTNPTITITDTYGKNAKSQVVLSYDNILIVTSEENKMLDGIEFGSASAVVSGGIITGVNIINQGYGYGNGYTEPPEITVSDCAGYGAKFNVSINSNGSITAINIVNGGSGYVSPILNIISKTRGNAYYKPIKLLDNVRITTDVGDPSNASECDPFPFGSKAGTCNSHVFDINFIYNDQNGEACTLLRQEVVVDNGSTTTTGTASNPLNSWHLRPKPAYVEKFFNELNDFQRVLLNRYTNPVYTSKFRVPIVNEEGIFVGDFGEKSFTWGTPDGWNLDISSNTYVDFINMLASASEYLDGNRCDNIYRMLTHESLKNMDWSFQRIENDELAESYMFGGSKITSILRVYGREFDEIKKYISGIELMNNLSYNQMDNYPDALLKDNVSYFGWQTVSLETKTNRLDETCQLYKGWGQKYNADDLENEFYRRLLLNSPYLASWKGTKHGLEMMMNLFGIDRNIWDINEYVYVATGSLKTEAEVEHISELNKSRNYTLGGEIYYTGALSEEIEPEYFDPDDLHDLCIERYYYGPYIICPLCGPYNPATHSGAGLLSGTMQICPRCHGAGQVRNYRGIPAFKGNTDILYYQQRGGWWQETMRNVGLADSMEDLYRLNMNNLQEGMLFYVKHDGVSNSSHYWLLVDRTKFTSINGWYNLTVAESVDPSFSHALASGGNIHINMIALNETIDIVSGNNPHSGSIFGYDMGCDYLQNIGSNIISCPGIQPSACDCPETAPSGVASCGLFKYVIDNSPECIWSKSQYTDLVGIGFNLQCVKDTKKCWGVYTNNDDILHVDNTYSIHAKERSNTDPCDFKWYNGKNTRVINYPLSPEFYRLVNVKNIDLTFNFNSDEECSEFYDTIFPYLEEMIPSTSIINLDVSCSPWPPYMFVAQLQVPSDKLQNLLPFTGNGNITVDWGDGNVETFSSPLNYPQHTYSDSGQYYVTAVGNVETMLSVGTSVVMSNWRNNLVAIEQWGDLNFKTMTYGLWECINLVRVDKEATFNNLDVAQGLFVSCSSITETMEKIIAPNLTDVTALYSGCSKLKTIHNTLFKECREITAFYMVFSSTAIETIPEDLFENNEKANHISAGFGNTNIKSIPPNLFRNNTLVVSFAYTFYGCDKLLSIPKSLFDNNKNVTHFECAFYECTSLDGDTPSDTNNVKLWERQGKPGYPSTLIDGESCFCNCTGLDDYGSIDAAWKTCTIPLP